FFDDTATPEISTLSLHDALPISAGAVAQADQLEVARADGRAVAGCALEHFQVAEAIAPEHAGIRIVLAGIAAHHERRDVAGAGRSEEHTSELQSRENLVCRLLLE